MKYDHIYQVQVKACVTCQFGRQEDADTICTNQRSKYCAEFVSRGFQCRAWSEIEGAKDVHIRRS